MFNGQKPSATRLATFWVVLAVHVGVIFIPLGVMWFVPQKPKQIAFRVKLGGDEPSSAPEIGPPQRRRPTGTVGGGAPPPPPQPQEAPAPKPIPAPQPKPTPKPIPKPVQKPKPLPKKVLPKKPTKKKPVPKKVVPKKPIPKIDKRKQQQLMQQKRLQEQRRKQQQLAAQKRLQEARRRQLQQQVHHDNSWKNFDPNKPFGGGSNTNIAVPIGDRDRGQVLGNVNGTPPAGGASEAEKEYLYRLSEYCRERWKVPAGIFVTSETAVTIGIQWDARGRVISKRITKASPNPMVTQSVKNMLDHLDYIPIPPPGIVSTINFTLIPEN